MPQEQLELTLPTPSPRPRVRIIEDHPEEDPKGGMHFSNLPPNVPAEMLTPSFPASKISPVRSGLYLTKIKYGPTWYEGMMWYEAGYDGRWIGADAPMMGGEMYWQGVVESVGRQRRTLFDHDGGLL